MNTAGEKYDLLIIGGGINGAGIARDAAGRGLRVLLCEQHDLAAHTSSSSTKLIHGGLRYLEYYEFGLVRKALKEREILLRNAPHLIRPLRFVMPHVPSLRPAWMIRAGLFLYDHLSRRDLSAPSRSVNLRSHATGAPLADHISRGFIYSDAWAEDARLVVLNALDAKERGAIILTRTCFVSAQRKAGHWNIQLSDDKNVTSTVHARALINASGPWASQLLHQVIPQPQHDELRLIKGSHIVTKKLFDHDHAYILQNPDKRIIFAIPYQEEFTLIGTTDIEYTGNPDKLSISAGEVDYLCKSINRYFKQAISPSDVIWSYAGVRPLLAGETASPSALTRDYHLVIDKSDNQPPFLSIFGGKITTFRRLAEDALALLKEPLGLQETQAKSWTSNHPLPGGDLPHANFSDFLTSFCARHPWLPQRLANHYASCYGSRADALLKDINSMQGLGEELCPGLYEIEAHYLRHQEWATTAEDILWRRTKLGLHATAENVQYLTTWLDKHSR